MNADDRRTIHDLAGDLASLAAEGTISLVIFAIGVPLVAVVSCVDAAYTFHDAMKSRMSGRAKRHALPPARSVPKDLAPSAQDP